MKILENTMLSCIKRLTIINLKDSSAIRKKNDNIVYFTQGSRKHGGKIIISRFEKICFMMYVPQLANCEFIVYLISLCLSFISMKQTGIYF